MIHPAHRPANGRLPLKRQSTKPRPVVVSTQARVVGSKSQTPAPTVAVEQAYEAENVATQAESAEAAPAAEAVKPRRRRKVKTPRFKLHPLDDQFEDKHRFDRDNNWLLPKNLLIGRYPHVEKQDEAKLKRFLNAGITTYVSLQQELPAQEEMTEAVPGAGVHMQPYQPVLESLLQDMETPPGTPLSFVHFPIKANKVPTGQRAFHALITDLVNRLMAGERIFIHSYAGSGRAGVVAACLLAAAYSLDADEALERVQRAFGTRGLMYGYKQPLYSPETKEQEDFVREYINKLEAKRR